MKDELGRRLVHLFVGIILVSLIYFDIVTAKVMLVVVLIGLVLSLISLKIKIPVVYWFLSRLDRENDLKKFPGKGAFFYSMGVFLVLLLFDKDIAMASIIILAIGDSIAPLIGQYGSVKHPFSDKKFLEGTLGAGVVAFLAAMLFVRPVEAAFASFAAMIAEGIDLRLGINQLDDNIIMPLIAGVVIWVLRLII